MKQQRKIRILSWILWVSLLVWGAGPAIGAPNNLAPGQEKKITQADRQAAADRAAASGLVLETMGTANMAMPGAAPHYFSHPNYANSPLPGNVVSEWNAIAQEILQPTPMPGMPMPMGGTSMSAAFVYLSYVQGAVYNALVAIEGGYTPYHSTLTADLNASRDAAVAAAAYGVLKNYFPGDATLDGKYNAVLAAIPDSASKTDGIAVGQAAAAEIIALRAGDVLSGNGGYTLPDPGPGVWEPTALMPDGVTPMPPMDPWMAVLKPFLRSGAADLRPVAPPALDDPQYLLDLAEVREIGGAMSMTRTAEQTEVARFWTTNMVIQTNAAYRELATSRGLGLLNTARLMAMGNMAATDSLIATFDAKYNYNFWRPVTAIQNDATNPDLTWMPVVMTPNFPEYVAGHGSFASAQAEVYTHILGTAQIEIDLNSSVTGTTRHYATAADLRQEVVDARTWGGLHFRSSSELAKTMGQQLVRDALASYFATAPDLSAHVMASVGGIRKFVDTLPGLGSANANNLGQFIPVAVPQTVTINGKEADYYEIAVVQYREKMHSDLPATLLRGYVQISTTAVPGAEVPLSNDMLAGPPVQIAGHTGVTKPHYLGPTIVATKNRPVRIKFYNLLPTGMDGDLFIPVDTTVMGSGPGPEMDHHMNMMYPQNPMCGDADKPFECYTENRATLHLHGGISPWISDGTPHQWITPAGEGTPYPQGVSVVPVPDMEDSGAPDDGVMTFYYTNQQSARLMFYHDHSWGITRLNVYAGEAAPYIITDATEQALLNQGLIPGPDSTIPLVVQDKTFVPSEMQLAVSDETWDMARWGGVGNLWLPHVYSPAQNPGDSSGVNQFGRWAYGPWFWPPTSNVENGPMDNPYYDPTCDPDLGWCEPPLMPGVPYNSMGMEAFMDTPVVNGTVYPTVTLEPKAYRFRVLNAANDRFFNLSLYKADPAADTEVQLNPDEVAAALEDPTVFPTPVIGTEGPAWIQIGTEGGFLPAPVVIPAQPTTWVNDPTVFNAGNVDKHSLLLGPAERADVIVDLSAYAGQTLILYNDAPAAFPARDPRYDYYTGNGDYRDTGGTPPTLPGYGPNIRTVMQIRVGTEITTPSTVDLASLQTAFAHKADGTGVFESGQHPIVVGQGAYNSAYGTAFQNNGPQAGLVQIFDTSLTFKTLTKLDIGYGTSPSTLTMSFKPKMIQDEMGEAFEHEYGRMSGFLGVETPNAQAGLQNMILFGYPSPPVEILDAIELPEGVALEPISSADDGTQIWKITHNGVDTHPIHFHLYDVQLLNRVGWDGIIRKPEPNELGWKDTVRISPLEDTIVALRPLIPSIPDAWGGLPNSIRLIDPSMAEGEYLANTTQQEALGLPIFAFNPNGEPIDIINHHVNFGWEYVWHCHILSHEEMDMMHAQVVGVAPTAPTFVSAERIGNGQNRRYDITWIDNSKGETAFVIERRVAGSTNPWTTIATVQSSVLGVVPYIETGVGPGIGTRTYSDRIGNTSILYEYQVYAINTVGDIWDYSNPAFNEIPAGGGFPTLTVDSRGGNTTGSVSAILAPSNAAATAVVKNNKTAIVRVTWTDNANNETGFLIQRADNAAFTAGVVNATVGTGVTAFQQSVTRGKTFYYRVHAFNDTTQSGWSNTATVITP
jgi:FtsP/CotA-like multicopper oxidase with cupredoxin domain